MFSQGPCLSQHQRSSTFCLVVLLILACTAISSLGFSWKDLHEQASRLRPEENFSRQEESLASLESLYRAALAYLEDYDHRSARDVFQTILEKNPSFYAARWGLAECLRREHRHDDSVILLEELVSAHPDFSPAYISLAYIRYVQGQFNQSIALSAKVIQQGRRHVDHANFLRAHGLYAAARGLLAHYGGPFSKMVNGAAVWKYLDIMRSLDPQSAVVSFGLGSYYLLAPASFGRDLEKAEEYFMKALERDPRFPDVYVRLGQIYQLRGDSQKYQEYLQKALDLDSGNDLARDIQSGRCLLICFSSEVNP